MTRFQSDQQKLRNLQLGDRNIETIERLKQPKPPRQPLGQIVNIYNPTSVKYGDIMKHAYAEQFGYGRRRKRRHRGGSAYVDKYGEFMHAY